MQSQENRLLFPLKSEATKLFLGLTDVSEKTLLAHALNGFSRNNAVFLLDTHTGTVASWKIFRMN